MNDRLCTACDAPRTEPCSVAGAALEMVAVSIGIARALPTP
jgi:hypothetical protein